MEKGEGREIEGGGGGRQREILCILVQFPTACNSQAKASSVTLESLVHLTVPQLTAFML